MTAPDSTVQDLYPSAYTVEEHRQHCTGCGCTHHFSAVYSKTATPGYKSGAHLKPIDRPVWNLPIERGRTVNEQVPLCHLCCGTANLKHLRTPPQPPSSVMNVARLPEVAPKPKAPKRVCTVDEL